MQTFLPYPDFGETARCLDFRRLGKQRVEALQILRTLAGLSEGWVNHPAVRMWKGYEVALALYGLAVCEEWVEQGYKDTCRDKIREIVTPFNRGPAYYPLWLGDDSFHQAHKSNLIRKNPEHYRPLWPNVPDNLPYVWPGGIGS